MKVAVVLLPTTSAFVTSSMLSDGATSSSAIVKVPVASEIVAFSAPERVSVTVSFASSRLSDKTATVNSCDISPGAKVKVVDAIAV